MCMQTPVLRIFPCCGSNFLCCCDAGCSSKGSGSRYIGGFNAPYTRGVTIPDLLDTCIHLAHGSDCGPLGQLQLVQKLILFSQGMQREHVSMTQVYPSHRLEPTASWHQNSLNQACYHCIVCHVEDMLFAVLACVCTDSHVKEELHVNSNPFGTCDIAIHFGPRGPP